MDPATATDTPPVIPVKKSSSKKWLIGCGGCLVVLILGGIGFGAFIFFGALAVIKATPPYQKALASAQASPEVQEALGTPITAGMIPSGNVSTNNGEGSAELTIPISGPKGAGKIHYVGAKTGEDWTPRELNVTVDATGRTIDLDK